MKRTITVSLIAATAALAAAMPAQAQEMSPAEEFAKAAEGAKCGADIYPDALADVLAARGKYTRNQKRVELFHLDRCRITYALQEGDEIVALKVPGPIMDGMFAEALLRKQGGMNRLKPLAPVASYERPWFVATGRPKALDEMAVCLASIAPGKLASLFATQPGSSGERSAIGALSPEMGTCLQRGVELKAGPRSLRAALAEAMYHRVHSPTVAAR